MPDTMNLNVTTPNDIHQLWFVMQRCRMVQEHQCRQQVRFAVCGE